MMHDTPPGPPAGPGAADPTDCGTPAIRARGLVRRFGTLRAVDGVDLEVQSGEIFGCLGHNGSGKTTIVRLLNGVLDATSGSIEVLGLSPADAGERIRARTGVLTETPALDDRLTARETLRFAGHCFGLPGKGLDARIDALLQEFDLIDRGDHRIGGYSRGMRQKLALARALIHEPEILFLDEPTSGLDPVARRQLHERIRELARSAGRTVFLSTHDLSEAQQLCDHVAVLERGRVIAFGAPRELARRLAFAALVELEVGIGEEPQAARIAAPWLEGGTVAGRPLLLRGIAREEIPRLVEALAEAGVSVYRVAGAEPTLEDAYFALAGQEDG